MVQLGLLGSEKYGGISRVIALDDYGPLRNAGACKAHSVLGENGQVYIIKGAHLEPALPYVPANELIAVQLARLLGLPTLGFCVIEMAGQLFFGSDAMPDGTFHQSITAELFQQCENRERAYGLVVFDAWLCNSDRHPQNLIARCLARRNSGTNGVAAQGGEAQGGEAQGISHERLLLLLNDHSHCLIPPGAGPEALPNLDAPIDAYKGLDFVRASIAEAPKLRQAIDAVEALADEVITSVVCSISETFLRADEREKVTNFLIQRRVRLRKFFQDGRGCFSNLGGGDI